MAFTKSLRLLFIFPFVSSALVAPPTNVTLTCRNLQNILSWDYENDVPGLRFHVSIGYDSQIPGCPNEMWFNESSRRADLSFLSNPNNVYHIELKAVLGEDESEIAPKDGIEFTYFSSALFGEKCLLDFPPVDITTQEHQHIQVEFKHPWLVYKDGLYRCKTQKKKKKNDQENKLPNFKYTISVVGQDKSLSVECDDAVCKTRLQVDMKQDKHCLKINGELELMTVVSTKEFCTEKAPPPLNHTNLIVGIIIAIMAALAFIATMVFWKKTSPALAKLSSIFCITPKPNNQEFKPLQDDPSPVTVSPWPVTPEEPLVDTVIIKKSDEDYHQRIKLSPNNQALTEEPEEEGTSDDPYMSEQKLDSDPEEPDLDEPIRSPYECRAVVLELAPEDCAEGYRA
ncbi:interferon gamma receptor 1-like precursor [Poecilia reticulata]|uniref:Interferon gamma receptor 1-like n=1 Tax=Poecilia reticulata TaxID=8081 RepID=A0A3P9NUP6_POERE|nr:interferon gamma receptor 1-like precursor [Poecilia reticulata]